MTAVRHAVTFAVHDVAPLGTELESHPADAHLLEMFGTPVLESSLGARPLLRNACHHGLVDAIYLAWANHRPLVLDPDAVWLTITQQVAKHIAAHAEDLRTELVSFAGRKELVLMAGPGEGCEAKWASLVPRFAAAIEREVGAEAEAFRCDFSTSGPTERVAAGIVSMGAFERFFEYAVCVVCGIPTVTLEGSVEDWKAIAKRIAVLDHLGLGAWRKELAPVLTQFVRAAMGHADRTFWQGIVTRENSICGRHPVDGWFAKFICPGWSQVDVSKVAYSVGCAPVSVSAPGREKQQYELMGGLLGVEEVAGTGALRPVVGWAVREGNSLDSLMTRIRETGTLALPYRGEACWELPDGLIGFLQKANGGEFAHGGTTWRIPPHDAIVATEEWFTVCETSDGRCFQIGKEPVYSEDEHGPGDYPVKELNRATGERHFIAGSFVQFLDWILRGA